MVLLIIGLPYVHAAELNLVSDLNGNLITGDSFYRTYNDFNQLVEVRAGNTSSGPIIERYLWQPMQERILAKDVYVNGAFNYTVYYVSDQYVVVENSTGNWTEEYIKQDGILVAQKKSGVTQAVHNDVEGSTTLITDSAGNVVENSFFSPFGEITSGGAASRFDSEGKEFDPLTQDYDFHFRKYRPDWARFTQPDGLLPNVYDPQQLNRYAFERNNPYRYVDPDGHDVIPPIWWSPPLALLTLALSALTLLGIIFYPDDSDEAAGQDEQTVEQPTGNMVVPDPTPKELQSGTTTMASDSTTVDIDVNAERVRLVVRPIQKDEDARKDEEFVHMCDRCVVRPQQDSQGNLMLTVFNREGAVVASYNVGGGGGKGWIIKRDENGTPVDVVRDSPYPAPPSPTPLPPKPTPPPPPPKTK